MEIKVFWTETALNNLEEIFKYFEYKASVRTARRLVKNIVKTTLKLQNSPNLGKKEELLINRKPEYRSLVEGNYRIIYWVEDFTVKIAAVFDCRQNPEKAKII